MSDIKSLGYVKIQTNDIDRWRTFAFDVLGFAKGTGPDASALYLRMDERAARIVVVPGETDEIVTVGWEVRDRSGVASRSGDAAVRGCRRQTAAAGRGRRPARRRSDHLLRPDGHHDRGVPRRRPRPQPRRNTLRRPVRHRRTGIGACGPPRDRPHRRLRLLHRRAGLSLPRRVACARTPAVRPGADQVPRRQRAAPQPGDRPLHARRCPRAHPCDGGSRHPRRGRPWRWTG